MRALEIIIKKRDGHKLTYDELKNLVMGYVDDKIPDYQFSAFLMAVFLKGLDKEESQNLTRIMMESGEQIDLSQIKKTTLDKHSTGGVGDKTSLFIAPILACFELALPKMSGRGLGHTGGTLDKLESIPGFKVELSREEFFRQVNEIGLAIIGQSGNLTPADKKIYALRDVTGTVESIPLVVSSIMSKKLAAGADNIILDVKCGNGAFMKDIDRARTLAQDMVEIGKAFNKRMKALITNMDQPLGYAIGNALEVIEVIDALRGEGPEDFLELSVDLSVHSLLTAKIYRNYEEAKFAVWEKISSGEALEKFRAMILAQGGDGKVIDDYQLFNLAKKREVIYADNEGYVKEIKTEDLGLASMILGAGRATKDDIIDPGVGIKFYAKIADKIEKGQILAEVFYRDDLKLFEAKKLIQEAIAFSDDKLAKKKTILEIIE